MNVRNESAVIERRIDSLRPPIYCVSLDGSLERRARMRRRLAHHRLLERTQLVDAISPPAVAARSTAWKDRAGAASFASHLKAMRTLLADPRSGAGAVVCEDDVLLHNEFSDRLAGVLENLPAEATFCSLGYMVERWERPPRWAGRDPERRNLCHLEPGAVWGTHCYWIAPAYARQLLDRYGDREIEKLPTMTELIAFESGGYLSYPPLALQDVIDSTVRPPDDLGFHLRGQAAWPYRDYSECEQGDDRSPLALGPTPRRSIGLCMIVRNESAVIERCLDSVRPLIDTWTICDTGSDDGTPALIERALADLPGRLYHRPWVDFGHNRTELAELARGSADYLLLIDADMTLVRNGALPPLVADAYLLRHLGQLEYAVPRLVRGDRRWWFEGATHEYLATEGAFTQELLEALAIEHHGDSGTRDEKFDRDVRLLEAAIARDAADARSTFYLAQTFREGGQEGRAIELYRRRVELGGWDQEVFYAAYQLGVLVGHRDPDAAIPLLLDAHELRPGRAEPLYELARLSRLRRRYQAAYMFAYRGASISRTEDVLFVHRDVYEWGMRFERAVAAYWLGQYEEALELNEALLAEHRMPPAYAAAAESNRNYCLEALGRPRDTRPLASPLAELVGDVLPGEIQLDVDPPWPQFNPSVAREREGFRMIVRTANYRIYPDGGYDILDGDGIVRTLNYLLRLDSSMKILSIAGLEDRSLDPRAFPTAVQGWEDLRLFQVGARWFATANTRDRNPEGRAEVALLELDGSRILGARVLRGPEPGRHEKNWMPFVKDDRLYLLYSCAPTVVYECDLESAALHEVARHDAPAFAARLRGGSGGFRVDGGWLFAVHEAFDDGRRTYLHRLILLGDDFRLAGASQRFRFADAPVELCLGLVAAGDRLVFSYGENDASAHLAVCSLEAALELIEPC